MFVEQDKVDYRPFVSEEKFTLRNKLGLFISGFSRWLQGLPSFLWDNFVFIFVLFTSILAVFFWGKEQVNLFLGWLKSFEHKEFAFVVLGAFSFALPYCASQMISVGNILRVEKLYLRSETSVFVRWFNNLKILLITGLFLTLAQSVFSFVFQSKISNNFEIASVSSWLWAGLALCLGFFTYIVMLGTLYIYIAESILPMPLKWSQKIKFAIEKMIGSFSFIFPTLLIHSLLMFLVCAVLISVGLNLFEPLVKYFEAQGSTGNVPLEVFLALVIFGFITFYFIYVVLNRAKVRSFVLLFLLIEDMEEYDERLTKPLKEEKEVIEV